MRKIAIIGALPSELEGIQTAQCSPEIIKLARYTFYKSKLNDREIITACCGIGKVNAALCTQILIDHFGVECIINTGIAGGMYEGIHVCDIVISEEVLAHDLDPHFLDDYPPYKASYPSDKALQFAVSAICEERNIPHYQGVIISGDAFISDEVTKQSLKEKYNPYAVDMETAAIGFTAWRNSIPFVSVRCISDLADDHGEESYESFEQRAANRVAEIVMKACEVL